MSNDPSHTAIMVMQTFYENLAYNVYFSCTNIYIFHIQHNLTISFVTLQVSTYSLLSSGLMPIHL